MSSVEFDDSQSNISTASPNSYASRKIFGTPEEPALSRLLIKVGITKNPKQAYYALICIGIGSIITTVIVFGYFVLGIGHPEKVQKVFPKELQEQLKEGNQLK